MSLTASIVAAVAAVLLLIAPRLILELVGRAGHGVARLFLPPEGTEGWSRSAQDARGIQEDDRRWPWRATSSAPERPDTASAPASPAAAAGIEIIDL